MYEIGDKLNLHTLNYSKPPSPACIEVFSSMTLSPPPPELSQENFCTLYRNAAMPTGHHFIEAKNS